MLELWVIQVSCSPQACILYFQPFNHRIHDEEMETHIHHAFIMWWLVPFHMCLELTY